MSYSKPVDMNQIVFKKVEGFPGFGIGKYSGFKVVVMEKNGYINAPKALNLISQETDKTPKKFNDFTRSLTGKELSEEISCSTGISVKDLMIIVPLCGTNQEICGTYVHPDLIPHIASWASAKFGVKVSKIVNAYMINEFKEELFQAKLKNKEQLTTIEQLRADMKKMADDQATEAIKRQKDAEKRDRQYKHLMNNVDDTKEEAREAKNETKKAHADIRKIIKEVIPVVANDRVPTDNVPGIKLERCAIIRNRVTDPDEEWMYYIMCGQQGYVKTKVTSYLRNNPGSKVMLTIEYQANSKNLLHRIKSTMGHQNDQIDYHGNNIDLLDEYMDEEFIEDIKRIDRNKYNVDLKGIVIV